ncbi:MAG: hypothetical protein OEU26_19950 [Candidatus Tectomicrobia bacterium]|nr:hypothetical protein [Candidatus Tectomicrobia bacterium]
MGRRSLMVVAILVGITVSRGLAQEVANLVTSHHTQVAESGYTDIAFTLRDIPEEAMLSFAVRFEPRFV